MELLKFLPALFVFLILASILAIGGYLLLGPGKDQLSGSAQVIVDSVREAATGESDVLGAQQPRSVGRGKESSPVKNILEEVLSPVERTTKTVEKTVDSLVSFPKESIEAIRDQICEPR